MDSPPLRLASLGGAAPPAELAADLRVIATLPPEAIPKFWSVLEPALEEPLPPAAAELLDAFSAAYGVDADELARAIRASKFLVREAARFGVSADAMQADLERLCPDDTLVREVFLSGFAGAWQRLRQGHIARSLREHGRLLTKTKWRIDTVRAYDAAEVVGTPVVLLTLEYLEGDTTQRLTLQALPDTVSELKAICERVLG